MQLLASLRPVSDSLDDMQLLASFRPVSDSLDDMQLLASFRRVISAEDDLPLSELIQGSNADDEDEVPLALLKSSLTNVDPALDAELKELVNNSAWAEIPFTAPGKS